jgi:hypothetical protein
VTEPPGNARRGLNLDGGIHEIPLPPPAAGRLWLCGKHAIGPDPEGLLAPSAPTPSCA